MAAQIQQHAPLKGLLPADGLVRVDGAGMEIASLKGQHPADAPLIHQFPGPQGDGQIAVVKHHTGEHAGFFRLVGNAPGSLSRIRQGLIDI